MANYEGKTKSNIFKVTDVVKFGNIMENCVADWEDAIEYNVRGNDVEFTCDGVFGGIADNAENMDGWDKCIEEIQSILAPDSVCIITEIGAEDMDYLVAESTLLTRTKSEVLQLSNYAEKRAAELLKGGNINE